MSMAPEVQYTKSTVNLKTPPSMGDNINVFLRPGDQLALGFDLSKAKLQIVGGDVIATLPNGGTLTFVALGLTAFEANAPILQLFNGTILSVDQILSKIHDIGEASKDALLVSGPASLDELMQESAKDQAKNEETKKEEAPVNDYNAYYADAQPIVKLDDNKDANKDTGKYLQEAVTEYTSNNLDVNSESEKNKSTEDQAKSKDNVADVSAALSFDIGFYQIASSESTDLGATTVLGGTGSTLGNTSKTAAAQFQAETLDYRDSAYPTVITADNPALVNDTYLTKLVRMSISQPVGFEVSTISIAGLSNAFQILKSDYASANSTGGGWTLSAADFVSTSTDGGQVIEFYIRYIPGSTDLTLLYDYLMQLTLTSTFSLDNVPTSVTTEVVVPEITTLTTIKDVGVVVKDVESASDYTYTGHYATGFVLPTTANSNIIYTSHYDSTVEGGLSSDTIFGSIGNDTLNGSDGNDIISGGSGINTLIGGNGIDTANYDFIAKYSDDFLFANSGYSNDAKGIYVDLQSGIATGKSVYDSTADVTTGEALLDISDTLGEIEYVVGSKYDDTILGDDANNKLVGGEGNDTLEGRGGMDWLDGGAGNDWLIGSTDDYMIDGGDNTDTIDFSNNSNGITITLNGSSNGSVGNLGSTTSSTIVKNVENVSGTQYKDIINGDSSDNLLIGGYDHSATIAPVGMDDTITGGAGSDTIVGDMMIDSVKAGVLYGGNDVLSGGSENDTIYGDSAPILSTSTIVVSSDQSVEYVVDNGVTLATIHGGNDTLQGGLGDDYLEGGSGYDTVDFSAISSAVTVNLSSGVATGQGYDTLRNIENVIGSNLNDTLTGNALVNTLSGGSGSDWVNYTYASGVNVDLETGVGSVTATDIDTLISIENIIGSSGDDTLSGVRGVVNTLLGENGNDIFYGYFDGDVINGGAGIDAIDYGNMGSGIDVTLGGSSTDTLISIENLYGTNDNDTLAGDSNNNTIAGRDGNDTLIGGAGNDVLIGGNGLDMADYSGSSNAIVANLTTNSVSDGMGGVDTLSEIESIRGSLYTDVMTGSVNQDTLIGNSGNDTFYATTGNDIYWGNNLNIGSTASNDNDLIDYSTMSGINHIVAQLSSSTASGTITTYDGSNAVVSTDTVYNIENVMGTSGDDTLLGGANVINTLQGAGGDDTLMGNLDGDYLNGGTGVNTADYSSQANALTVDLASATMQISMSSNSSKADTLTSTLQIIKTGSGNDHFIGNSSANTFVGGAGNDTFVGGAGDDTFIGGISTMSDSGIDTANYSSALFGIDVNLETGFVTGNAATEGTDTLYGIENIIGTNLIDTLKGEIGVINTLQGGAGNDTFYGNLDGDLLDGGTDINLVDYTTNSADMVIDLTNSKAYNAATSATYDRLVNIQNATSGSGDDTLIGASGVVNTLKGGAGDDHLRGNFDGDTLDGQGNLDTLAYNTISSAVTVDLSAKSIALSSDTSQKDYFSNIEVIQTGSGNDHFTLSSSSDATSFTLDGGAGNNTLDYGSLSVGEVSVDLSSVDGSGYATVSVNGGSGNDTIIHIDNISGSQNSDTLMGNSASNSLHGNAGNDTLQGGSGNDSLYGDAGDDTIIADLDNTSDYYEGGDGSDTVDYSSATTVLTLSNGTLVTGASGSDTLKTIEIFKSGLSNDILTAGTASMTLYGNDGADTLTGGSNDDVLYGGSSWSATATTDDASNQLVGGAGNDTLYAGSQGDRLIGGTGNDFFYGGAGVDTVDYSTSGVAITANLANSTIVGDGLDTIDTSTIEILKAGNLNDVITGSNSGVLTTIYAGSGNDSINGGSLSETLYGEAGNDSIRGNGGTDEIYAGDGNDTIYGTTTAIDSDIIYGGNGTLSDTTNSDTLDFSDNTNSALGVVVDMSTQNGVTTAGTAKVSGNTVATFYQIENIMGGSGNDLITGDSNANTLQGGAGNDTIFVSDGLDVLDGGSGTDTVDFSSRASSVNVNLATLQIINNGNNEAQTIQNIENLIGGSVNDTLYGDGMANTLWGNDGADTLVGNDGTDVLYGGVGNDSLDGGADNDTLYGEEGDDTLVGGSGNDTLDGGLGNDTFIGGTGDDTFIGGDGIDIADYRNVTAKVVIAPNSDGTLTTGLLSTSEGTDVIGDDIEIIYGSNGYGDTITGNDSANTLYGWAGNDTLRGASGDDVIYGGDGNDTIEGGLGADILSGGNELGASGTDTVDYSSDTSGVIVNLNSGITINTTIAQNSAQDGGSSIDTITNFYKVLGSNYADTMIGNTGSDYLSGNGGDDWFYMSAGNDTIYGGTTSQTSGDTVDFIYASTAGIIANLSTNNASGTDIGTDVMYEIENVSGTNFNDTITGDSGSNILAGRALDDSIYGGSGNDLIYGDDNSAALVDGIQTGHDSLLGQDGDDTIYGGLGNDSLWGGNDNDILYGGSGNDYLNGNSGINQLYGNDGDDVFELTTSTATNTISGGNGTDLLNFHDAGSAITLNLSTLNSAQASGGAGTITLTDSLENVSGSNNANDIISGNSLANTLWGNAGADTLYGSTGSDLLYGGEGNDILYADTTIGAITDTSSNILYGGEGNDTLYGSLGVDTLYGDDSGSYGTACNDVFMAISATDGSDFMDGGQGWDTANYANVGTAINVTLANATNAIVTIASGDNDTIVNIENFIGGSGNDTITGSSTNNSLNGGLGDDILIGAGGDDTLVDTSGTNTFSGGSGNDTITGNGASSWLDYILDGISEGARTTLSTTLSQSISTTRGNDVITSVSNINGSNYNDVFYGTSSVNTLLGNDGNDFIEGYGGSDILDGGDGIDTVSYQWENKISVVLNDSGSSSVGVWNGSNYTTEVDTISNFENIAGSNSGNSAYNGDTISGNASNNAMWGYAGDDTLYGGAGNDSIDGGSDNDKINGGTGADIIIGGSGNDILRGGGSSLGGANTADGSADTIYGNEGNDTIYGMLDGDTLYGGDASTDTATDILRYDELSGKNIYVNLSTNEAYEIGNSSVKDTISGFEYAIGSSGNDSLVGNASSNTLVGNSGNDTLERGTLGGTDVFYGDDIADSLSGNDTFLMSKSDLTNSVTMFGGQGVDTLLLKDVITASDSPVFTKIYEIENVQLADGANSVTIDVNDVTLLGGSGNDTFKYSASAFDSHDIIDGGGGTNTVLFTSNGTLTESMFSHLSNIQQIQLADGGNTITLDTSALGATLLGGSGNDIFNYSIANLTSVDTLDGAGGNDTIAFLDTGTINESDLLHVSNVESIQLASGTNTMNVGSSYTILGSASSDTIVGGSGYNNTIYAGNGDDTLKFAIADFTSSDTIDGGLGTNTLEFSDHGVISSIDGVYSNIQKIQFASTGTNTITLDINGMTLIGGNDNDTFNYAIANLSSLDIINGSAGNDTLAFSDSGTIDATSKFNNISSIEVIQLANGVNTVTNFSKSNVSLIGGSGNDTITGTSAVNTIFGGSGNDTINGGGGADLLYGDDGDDIFNTSIANFASVATFVGGNGNDTIILSDAGNVASTKVDSSIEYIQLASGTNTIDVANVTVLGTSGNDSIIGGSGGINNIIHAGIGNDTIEFALGNLAASDTIIGGNGTDIFKVTGSGTLNGALFQNVTEVETLNLSGFSGTATLDSSAIDKFSTIDASSATGNIDLNIASYTTSVNVTTGSGNDTITIAPTQNVTINGGTGADTLTLSSNITGAGSIAATLNGIETIQLANGGNNVAMDYNNVSIVGGTGDDTFNYAIGNLSSLDIINGGLGADTLNITGSSSIVDSAFTHVSNIEVLDLTNYTGNSVTLATNADNNSALTLNLGNTSTTVNASGFTTDIVINAGSGNDVILAGTSANTITTGNGNNSVTITSASLNSSDILTGGSGVDTLIITGSTVLSASSLSGVSALEVLDLSSYTGTLALGSTALNFTSIILGSSTLLSGDASVLSGKTITGSGVINVTNLDATLNADFSSIASTTTLNVDWSGSATYAGNLTNVDTLTLSNGVMSTTDDILVGHSVTGSAGLVVDVNSDLAFDWSQIGSALDTTLAFSGGTTYTQSISNVDTISLASGVSVDISGATISSSTTSITGSTGSETLSIDSSTVNTLSSIDLGTANDTLHVSGNTSLDAVDFGKISNVETLDLTAYTGLADVSSTSGITQLNTDDSVNSITIDYAMNITDTGGADTLYTTASVDMSSSSISGIETLSVGSGTTATLDYADLGGGKISTLEGAGRVSVNGTTTMDIRSESVDALSNDALHVSGTAGDDTFVLDFSQLDEVVFDGSSGTDSVTLMGSNVSAIDDATAFSNIESLDISSLGLDSGGLSINASALYAYDSNTTSLVDAFTLDVANSGTSISNISLDNVASIYDGSATTNVTSGEAWALASTGDYTITTTNSETLYLHVV